MQRLKRSNPHIIYLIFTGAIAHLSGVRALRASGVQIQIPPPGAQSSPSTSASFTAQYNLMNCVAALREISTSWPLAERCHRIMTGLMEAEGLLNNEEAFQSPNPVPSTCSIGPPPVGQYDPQIQHAPCRRSRSVERRGFRFTPINAEPSSSEPPRQRRRHESGSGTEDDAAGGIGNHKRSSRGGHRAHPYLSRHPSSSAGSLASHNRGHALKRESPTSSSSATGTSSVIASGSPPAATAASLLSLASSASSSHTYLPTLGTNTTGTPSHSGSTPPASGMGRQMDFTQLPQMLQQHQQQQPQSDDPNQQQQAQQGQQQQQPQHQPPAQSFQQQNQQQNQQGDPYLVDFDPFSATGWATLEQDPFQQPSFYMNA